MTFSEAWEELKKGKYIRRADWRGPYLYRSYSGKICRQEGHNTILLVNLSMLDIVAEDWEVKPCDSPKTEQTQLNEELHAAAKPLRDYLCEHGRPHDCVLVSQTDAEVLEGRRVVPFSVKD